MNYVDDDLVIKPLQELDETSYYKDENGNIKYHEKCEKCPKKCKQSFRVSKLTCRYGE